MISNETSDSAQVGQVADLLNSHRVRVHRKARAQYLEAKRLAAMNVRLGIPVIFLSTIAGTATFTSLATSPNPVIITLTGFVSVGAAVMAALQTFLRFSERSERHRFSANEYSSLKRKMDLGLIKIQSSASVTEALSLSDALLEQIAAIDNDSIEAPDRFYDQAKKEQASDPEGV